MKKIDKVLWYSKEDLRKDIIKALFGENATLHEDYIVKVQRFLHLPQENFVGQDYIKKGINKNGMV